MPPLPVLIHLVTVLPAAARRGDIRGHRSAMVQLYVGGILVAGTFAVLGQGRLMF
ncbi:MAG: hypothetical protein RIR61_90 [Bacteroidota bacterium]|jgi:uncharacterized membrane protein